MMIIVIFHRILCSVLQDTIQRKILMIKMLKLVSGEELIADIKNLDDSRNDLIITEPFQFGMGQEGIVMVPFMPLADTEEVHLSKIGRKSTRLNSSHHSI